MVSRLLTLKGPKDAAPKDAASKEAASKDAAVATESASTESGRVRDTELVAALLRWGLLAMSAVTFLSAILIAAAHISDRYNVNHVSGTWLALASDARAGTIYRPLFENGVFGGTWYMPLQFVLQAGASAVTGEYIVSGKLLAYATAIALLAVTYVLLRRVGCSRLMAAALVSTVLLTPAGLFAATAIRGDSLPLLLQLAAVGLVANSTSRRAILVAGALCALAIMAKLAAVWAPVAIVIWLFVRERRRLVDFVGVFAGSLVALLAVFELASDGRMSDTLLAVGGAGNSGSSPVASVSRIFDLLVRDAGPIWLLLPFALMAIALAAGERRLSLYQLALLAQLPLLVIVFSDPGSDFNHLVDLTVVTVLVVGELWVRSGEHGRELTALGAAIAIALLLGAADAYRQSLKSEVADAAKTLAGRQADAYPTNPLKGYVKKSDRILSEDPMVPLLLGQRPLLLDAVSLRRVGLDHPEWIESLRSRIAAKKFNEVVLVHPIEDSSWYGERNFGPVIRDEIRRDYRLVAKVSNRPLDYWVYAPRGS